mmetsp:Transcript_57008/g.185283  ORF Transcript_57008/g.185283 Transcript_57008/m.185283 type:complete len:94 (+) Transcript_57008:840-1121(+)
MQSTMCEIVLVCLGVQDVVRIPATISSLHTPPQCMQISKCALADLHFCTVVYTCVHFSVALALCSIVDARLQAVAAMSNDCRKLDTMLRYMWV